jgi:hypothetical protein
VYVFIAALPENLTHALLPVPASLVEDVYTNIHELIVDELVTVDELLTRTRGSTVDTVEP